jgi:2-polyprenyl-3-methyl-5-hydroxy-6-metoxy-1,4-benzoquinol methylase
MHEKRFEGAPERLRSPERVAQLELERVTGLCLEGKQFTSVLDVGTGSGLFAESFFMRGLEVSGVDTNPEMLTAARQFVPSAEFRIRQRRGAALSGQQIRLGVPGPCSARIG